LKFYLKKRPLVGGKFTDVIAFLASGFIVKAAGDKLESKLKVNPE